MRKKEIRSAIKTVFSQLYDLIGLYEETECYNRVPGDKSADSWKYLEKKLFAIRRTVDTFLPGESETAGKLHTIVDETEHFVKSYERPGTVLRWKQLNPQLVFFDCSFEMMDALDKETYLSMQRGLTNVRLSLYPDEEFVAARNAYFEEIRKKNEEHNLKYSEDRIFQNEMLATLKAVFEHDFQEYF